jgi:XTP/dITP diphosphohydrolase
VPVLLLPASTRNAPGLLTGAGWRDLAGADTVLVSCAHPAWGAHLREIDVDAEAVALPAEGDPLPDALAAADGDTTLVWLLDDSPAVPHLLRRLVTAGHDVDLRFASPVAPGSEVVESARIVHVLRSPGGDAWSAAQTHESLARYLLEETYEVLDALESGRTEDLPGELGDLLFQVVFHARLGAEAGDPFTVDDVARTLNEKLLRRTPHVFGDATAASLDEIWEHWDAAKAAEAPRRGTFEGIPVALPALQRAFKMVARARRAGDGTWERLRSEIAAGERDDHDLALALLDLAAEAQTTDTDPESALRALLARLAAAEAVAGPVAGAPGVVDG